MLSLTFIEWHSLSTIHKTLFSTHLHFKFSENSIIYLLNFFRPIELRHYRPKKIVFDETHPDYQETPCAVYGDHSVLLEGMKQAQVLTNTVLVDPELLPTSTDTLSEQELPPVQDKLVKR